MSRSESWKTWAIIIAILIGTGLLAAVWPLLTSQGPTTSSGLDFGVEPIILQVPPLPGGLGGDVVEINPILAMLVLSILVIGAVVVTGIVIAVINMLVSRLITRTESSEKYRQKAADLEKDQAAKLKEKQTGRESANTQQRDYSHWAVVATSAAILFFAVCLGYLFSRSIFPSGHIISNDEIINISLIITGIFVLVTLLVLALRMSPKRLENASENEKSKGIPWDTIAVLVSFVLVVGLGIGLMIYFGTGG